MAPRRRAALVPPGRVALSQGRSYEIVLPAEAKSASKARDFAYERLVANDLRHLADRDSLSGDNGVVRLAIRGRLGLRPRQGGRAS